MARTVKEAEETEEIEVQSASVHTENGAHVRTYTREVHGDNFEELAKEMAAQHQNSTIKLA